MGKVFSWDKIERKEIPELSSFSVLIDKIKRDLEAAESVLGGLFYGSVLWGSYNCRSDIDCLVVYDSAKQYEAIEVFQGINQVAVSLHIPIELNPIDLRIAKTSLHSAGTAFTAHLRYAVENGGIIKENPLPILTFDNTSVFDDIRRYLCNKIRALEKGISALPVMEDERFYGFLQKVLEAPTHVARKILLHHKEIQEDSKQRVVEEYLEIAGAKKRELFAKLVEADSRYTAELLLQVQQPDKIRYLGIIKELKELTSDALEFVKLNALSFS